MAEVNEEMKIGLDLSSLQQNRWYEYAERFVLGGLITTATGEIARRFGPEVAGLFLAFPAIFPSGATLIAKHQVKRKQKAGMPGRHSGRAAAGLDASGAAMGSLGLIAFGWFVWQMLPQHSTWLVLLEATLLWLVVVFSVWRFRHALPKIRRMVRASN
jgi:hypothetical protein